MAGRRSVHTSNGRLEQAMENLFKAEASFVANQATFVASQATFQANFMVADGSNR